MSLTILVVCTANICRSPAAATALRWRLGTHGIGEQWVSVASAGVHAMDGAPMCPQSLSMVASGIGVSPKSIDPPHLSRALTGEIVNSADLIFTADRTHRRDVVALSPTARTRTYTLRQGAHLAGWVASDTGPLGIALAKSSGQVIDPLDVLASVPALPDEPAERLRWFAAELDAARGLAPTTQPRWPEWDPHDIGDPHLEGDHLHPGAVKAAAESAFMVADAIAVVLRGR